MSQENQYGERFAPVLTPRDIKRESPCEAHLPIYGVPSGIGRDGLTGIRIPVSVTRSACTESNILTSWPTVCSALQSAAVNSIRPQGRYTSAGSLPMARLLVAGNQPPHRRESLSGATKRQHTRYIIIRFAGVPIIRSVKETRIPPSNLFSDVEACTYLDYMCRWVFV